MEERIIDGALSLIPYYPCPEVTLAWYQDPELVRQVDGDDKPYSLERLERMYSYLCEHGRCYYIRWQGELAGDATLQDSGEISIVVCRDQQGKGIGARCVDELIVLARELGFERIWARIYPFNERSRHVFASLGFEQADGGLWELCLP